MNRRRRYHTLVIGGYGNIGRAFLKLGRSFFTSFDRIVIMERQPMEPFGAGDALFLRGDIEDQSFLAGELLKHAGGFIFVNLCPSTDTYRIREVVSRHAGAYIDTSCSIIAGIDEHRYGVLMPHTFRPTVNSEPHFTCCGVNPGMVEIVARRIIRDAFQGGKEFDICYFENDQFYAPLDADRVGVSWSPKTLIDEVMLTPTFHVNRGKAVEFECPPTVRIKTHWQGAVLDGRLVGHEEVWNVLRLREAAVRSSFFSYSLHDSATEVLRGDASLALERLIVPAPDIPVYGTDSLAVQVVETSTGANRTLIWTVDHAANWRQLGINGVQLQVASSLLFFLELLVRSGDWSAGCVWCASDMPLQFFGWELIDDLFDKYGIRWVGGDDLSLCLEDGFFPEVPARPEGDARFFPIAVEGP